MPANPKYLSSSGQRFLKITAGLIGGFIITVLFHNAIGVFLANKGPLIITSGFTSFMVWAALMIIAFMMKNGWRAWLYYLISIILLGGIIFLAKF